MHFTCKAGDVYTSLEQEGSRLKESAYLTAFLEKDLFAENFRNPTSQNSKKRDPQFLNEILQQISEHGSELNDAFINSYINARQLAILDITQATLSSVFLVAMQILNFAQFSTLHPTVFLLDEVDKCKRKTRGKFIC